MGATTLFVHPDLPDALFALSGAQLLLTELSRVLGISIRNPSVLRLPHSTTLISDQPFKLTSFELALVCVDEISIAPRSSCPFTLPLLPLASSSLLVCSVGTAFSLSSMIVDSLPPCSRTLQTTFRDILSLSECDGKDNLEFHLTRPNFDPILSLRSLCRVVHRSRCALTDRSTCPHWTCCSLILPDTTFSHHMTGLEGIYRLSLEKDAIFDHLPNSRTWC
ncbi:hypothetical protein BLNAU_22709 [Blattamonas nauphoetae]|uniref:Uncharacterized protein n=1 Tax=Blattamonas nauphoetae TaxID=2049346 RepID=A0ABQ9WS91_9EUKA|nr:hypothetical protein BLNAU_22709 [Blattamonas nauphoetae]